MEGVLEGNRGKRAARRRNCDARGEQAEKLAEAAELEGAAEEPLEQRETAGDFKQVNGREGGAEPGAVAVGQVRGHRSECGGAEGRQAFADRQPQQQTEQDAIGRPQDSDIVGRAGEPDAEKDRRKIGERDPERAPQVSSAAEDRRQLVSPPFARGTLHQLLA